MTYDCILIDANSIGYAAMYQPNLARLTHEGASTSALHGLPMSIMKLIKQYPQAVPVILWDGKAHWRHALYPEYKSDRAATPDKKAIRDAYRKQTPVLRQMFFDLGLPQVGHPDAEADDLAGFVTRKLVAEDPDLAILMATTDSDWAQAIRERVHWLNMYSDQIIDLARLNSEDVKNGPFETPEQYLAAKCMAGDDSDNIEGIDGIGLKTGVKFLREHGSFQALWEKADQGQAFKGVKLLSMLTPEARQTYARNRQLMDWQLAPIPADLYLACPSPDKAAALELAERFGLKRIRDAFQSFEPDRAAWRAVLSKLDSVLSHATCEQDEEASESEMATEPAIKPAKPRFN